MPDAPTNDAPGVWTRIKAWYLHARHAADPPLKVLFILRFHLLIAAVVSTALYNDQSLEAMVAAAEDAVSMTAAGIRVVALGAAAATFLVLMLWYCARVLLYGLMPDVIDDDSPQGWFVRNAPRLVAVAPMLALSGALLRASTSDLQVVPRSARVLQGLGAGCLVLSVVAYIAWRIRRRRIQRRIAAGLPERERMLAWLLAWAIPICALLFFAAFAWRSSVASRLGALTVLILAAALWVPFGSLLVYWGSRIRLPLLLILGALALLWSALDLNDNHEIRHYPVPTRARENIHGVLDQWLAHRPDKDRFADGKYPVFIVATEGGGIYAATFTASVLGALQDVDSRFSSHVFAISGVSGGSVGAVLFAALCSQEHRSGPLPNGYQKAAMSILDRDFLAPVLAAGLFPDLVQRLIPIKVPRFDRARALENGFERAWTARGFGSQFNDDFDLLWPDFVQGSIPALLLNTTEVETGQRVVVTNLPLNDPRFNKLVTFRRKYPEIGMRLSTSAALSARFPIVTPAGYLWARAGSKAEGPVDVKRRYVDGGYFENSGAATAGELAHALRLDLPDGGAQKCRLIILRIGFATDTMDPKERRSVTAPDAPVTPARTRYLTQGLGEMLSPVRTLLNTRQARGASAIEQLRTLVRTLKDHNRDADLFEFTLREEEVRIPLGWLLSDQARKSISNQVTQERNQGSIDAVKKALATP